MRLGISMILGVVLVGCAHAPLAPAALEDVLVSVQNTTDRDVCAVHLWSDEEGFKSVENRLLPGSQLLEPTSAFRLHAGSRRDFTVPAQAPLRMEAVDCEGQLVESLELPAQPGTVVSLVLGEATSG